MLPKFDADRGPMLLGRGYLTDYTAGYHGACAGVIGPDAVRLRNRAFDRGLLLRPPLEASSEDQNSDSTSSTVSPENRMVPPLSSVASASEPTATTLASATPPALIWS